MRAAPMLSVICTGVTCRFLCLKVTQNFKIWHNNKCTLSSPETQATFTTQAAFSKQPHARINKTNLFIGLHNYSYYSEHYFDNYFHKSNYIMVHVSGRILSNQPKQRDREHKRQRGEKTSYWVKCNCYRMIFGQTQQLKKNKSLQQNNGVNRDHKLQ